MFRETFRGNRVDGIANIHAAAATTPFEPFHKLLARALVSHFNGLKEMFSQPLREGSEMFQRLLLVCLLFDSGGNGAEFQRGGVEFEVLSEFVVFSSKSEEDFIGFLLIGVARTVKRLD